MINNFLQFLLNYAPIYVLADHFFDSTIIFAIAFIIGSLIMTFASYIPIITLAIWIWGLVIAIQSYSNFGIAIYGLGFVLHVMWVAYVYYQAFNKKNEQSLSEIKKHSSLDIIKNDSKAPTKFKKINNDVFEVDLSILTKEEVDKLSSVVPPNCIRQSKDNPYIAYVYLSECLLSEQIRITGVLYELETGKKFYES